jgi:galactose mutarotase-like enzyme
MSGATNTFNNEDGLIVLEAGAAWEGSFQFGIE